MLIVMTVADVGNKTYIDSPDRGTTGHKNLKINDEKTFRKFLNSQQK